jgi:hypothetical protein
VDPRAPEANTNRLTRLRRTGIWASQILFDNRAQPAENRCRPRLAHGLAAIRRISICEVRRRLIVHGEEKGTFYIT